MYCRRETKSLSFPRCRAGDADSSTAGLMKISLQITHDPIDEARLIRERSASAGAGAVVVFLGVVRDAENGNKIAAIEYEAFLKMAERQFHVLFQEVESRWPIESIRLIHRLGRVKVNEASLWVEVIAPHRGEAFAACEHLINRMKEIVPIWKQAVNDEKMS